MATRSRSSIALLVVAAMTTSARSSEAQYSNVPERDLLPVTVGDKSGFIDREGKLIIPLKFDFVRPFLEGLATVGIDRRYGFIDKAGTLVVPASFDMAGWFKDGFAHVMVAGQWGFIRKTGEYAVRPQFENVSWFSEGLASVQLGDQWGYITDTGHFVIGPAFDSASAFADGKARVSKSGRYFSIDRDGNETTDREREDLTPEKRDGKWGYVNRDGAVAIPFSFEAAAGFSEGLAAVLVGDRWGYIDSGGRIVIEPQFDKLKVEPHAMVSGPTIWPFHEGFAAVHKDGSWRFIDKTGRAIPGRFSKADRFSGGIASVCGTQSCGYIATSGRVVWPWK